ncbi:MAG TPA: C40 family peptidase [Solimonas sp.]|nr:C40 family peptidase [Solimonas sp.]
MRHLLLRGKRAALMLSLSAALCGHPTVALAKTQGHGKRHASGKLEHAVLYPLRPEESFDLMDSLETERVMLGAMSMLGTRYRLGSRSEQAVDCSLLIQRVYEAVGLDVPRTTREQIRLGTAVELEDLRKGDLLFYRWQRRQLHVAIYIDNGYILHASPREGKVVVTQLNPSWRRRLVAVRRVL